MGVRSAYRARLAGQLGHPRGLAGRAVGAMLNRNNRARVTGAVDALEIRTGEEVADIGFGGGIGLGLLLDRVGPVGRVHGVEISARMLATAGRRYRSAAAAGRLHLHDGSLTDLPLPAGELDAAMTVNTIYFVDDLPAACAELARVVRPGGRLAVGLIDPDWLRQEAWAHGFRVRPVDEVTGTLTAAGLEVTADELLGTGPDAFHVLVCTPTPPSPLDP